MASSVSEMQLLGYEDNPSLLTAWTGTATSSATSSAQSPSLYDNVNNYYTNPARADVIYLINNNHKYQSSEAKNRYALFKGFF